MLRLADRLNGYTSGQFLSGKKLQMKMSDCIAGLRVKSKPTFIINEGKGFPARHGKIIGPSNKPRRVVVKWDDWAKPDEVMCGNLECE